MQRYGHTKRAEHLSGLRFGVPAVHLGEAAFQFGGADAIGLGEVFFGVEGVFFGHDIKKFTVAHLHGAQHFDIVEFELVLTQDGKALPRGDRDVA